MWAHRYALPDFDDAELTELLRSLIAETKASGRVTSYKLPVTSYKLQVTSYKLQVTSCKLQAASCKLQASYRVSDDKYVRIAAARVGKGRGSLGFGNARAVQAGLLQATSYKLQVTSYKLQARSYTLHGKVQVTSYKLQVTSYKLQVTSRPAPRSPSSRPS